MSAQSRDVGLLRKVELSGPADKGRQGASASAASRARRIRRFLAEREMRIAEPAQIARALCGLHDRQGVAEALVLDDVGLPHHGGV